jgi:hypothetical protein
MNEETEYITIINHTGQYIDLFKSVVPEDTENLYLATLLEYDRMPEFKEYLLELTADMDFTIESWKKFTNGFPIEMTGLIRFNQELMHVELIPANLKTMVECFLVAYYLEKNYQLTNHTSIFDHLPDIDCVLYPDFDEELIANLPNEDESSDSYSSQEAKEN